jgi:hypothetical protein
VLARRESMTTSDTLDRARLAAGRVGRDAAHIAGQIAARRREEPERRLHRSLLQ